jgi:tricarballylate dehydrogenase
MLSQYLGPQAYLLRPVARGGFYNKGEGIRMALRIGAAPAGQYGDFHAEPIDPRSGNPEPSIMVFPYGIVVNREGRRFMDEASDAVDRVYEPLTRAILQLPGGIAYFITDAKISDVPVYTRAIRTEQPAIMADSLRDLAKQIEVNFSGLEETIEAFNNAVPTVGTFNPLEPDGLATRGLQPPKSNWARSIDRPPFMAYPMVASVVFTLGALKVNTRAQVVSCDGRAIPGLYAAGETVGMYYGAYVGSTSVLKAIVFGRIAGRSAAQEVAQGIGRG